MNAIGLLLSCQLVIELLNQEQSIGKRTKQCILETSLKITNCEIRSILPPGKQQLQNLRGCTQFFVEDYSI